MNRLIPSAWLRPASLSTDLDRFIQDFWSQTPLASGVAPLSEGGPAVNVYETAEAFEVELELPGMALEEIEVVLEGRELSVRGERKIALPEAGTWQRRERFHGNFARTLRLLVDVDAARVQAQLHQGVLTVTAPKAESAKARKIAIQSKVADQPKQ
jgi:HSP20 family protein